MREKLGTVERKFVWLFGQKFPRVILEDHQLRPGIYQDREQIVFATINANKKLTKLETEFDQKLDIWLKRVFRTYLAHRTTQVAKKMSVSFRGIRLKDMRSRWGSCSSLGNLNFNWRLVHLRIELIDYVIIHELAHRLELNHSSRFWAIVRKFDPKYRTHRQQLKQLAL